jgi:ubiquinone/menaquinone biosynthesis C-methylase UbiE
MENWYTHSFGDDYLIVYKHRDMEKAALEVQAMMTWLALPAGAEVLDLCCGMGRHAIAMAHLRYSVTGFDLSESLLQVARRLDEHGKVTWVNGDMRQLPFDAQFDAVANLFTSFGYFATDEENESVLAQMKKVLRPGGKWLLDFLNPAYIKHHLVPRSEREQDGHQIVEVRDIVEGFVIKRIQITRTDGSHGQYFERVKLYERAWFEQMFERHGMKVQAVYGDYNQANYQMDSPRMIFVGEVVGRD